MENLFKKIEDLKVIVKKLDSIQLDSENESFWIDLALNNNRFQLEVLNITLESIDKRFNQE